MALTAEESTDSGTYRVPLSALEHYAYCPRQAALIHVEGVFTDDVNTVRGHIAHERVDKPGVRATAAPGMRQHYAVPVWRAAVGLYGRCDVVEIGNGRAVPVEHKIGAYRPGGAADLQAAAQAVCLREMLDLDVPFAEVFTHADRRRHRVELTDDIVQSVSDIAAAIRELLAAPSLPVPPADNRCRRCSLLDDCLPHALVAKPDSLFANRPMGTWDA